MRLSLNLRLSTSSLTHQYQKGPIDLSQNVNELQSATRPSDRIATSSENEVFLLVLWRKLLGKRDGDLISNFTGSSGVACGDGFCAFADSDAFFELECVEHES
jgi:hypothetical protein